MDHAGWAPVKNLDAIQGSLATGEKVDEQSFATRHELI